MSHIAVSYKIFEIATLFTIPVSFFLSLFFLVFLLLISQLIFLLNYRPRFPFEAETLNLRALTNLIDQLHVNKKMSEPSSHLKAKTNSFFEDN